MSYVYAGYGITLVAIGGYAAWMLRRGRALTRERS
jgi:heme exporter protein CcmD